MNGMWSFPFSALTLLVGRQEGHPARKKTWCWFVGGDDLTGAHLGNSTRLFRGYIGSIIGSRSMPIRVASSDWVTLEGRKWGVKFVNYTHTIWSTVNKFRMITFGGGCLYGSFILLPWGQGPSIQIFETPTYTYMIWPRVTKFDTVTHLCFLICLCDSILLCFPEQLSPIPYSFCC